MSLAVLADHMASKGRNGDTMLVHMAPEEVAGLHALALKHGGSLTINPETGLPEAFSLKRLLKSILPAVAGFALGPAGFGLMSAMQAGLTVGAVAGLAKGSLKEGIMAGLGAYGGANLGAAFTGAESAGATAAATEAAKTAGEEVVKQGLTGEAANQFVQNAASTAYSDFAAKPFMDQAAGSFQALKSAPGPLGGLPSLARPAMYAAAPIMADMMVPTNVQMPNIAQNRGMYRGYTYDPYGGTYIPQEPTYAAKGGLMESSGIVALADGGITDDQVKDAIRTSLQQGVNPQDVLNKAATFNITQDQLNRATQALQQSGYADLTVPTLAYKAPDTAAAAAPAASAGIAALAPNTFAPGSLRNEVYGAFLQGQQTGDYSNLQREINEGKLTATDVAALFPQLTKAGVEQFGQERGLTFGAQPQRLGWREMETDNPLNRPVDPNFLAGIQGIYAAAGQPMSMETLQQQAEAARPYRYRDAISEAFQTAQQTGDYSNFNALLAERDISKTELRNIFQNVTNPAIAEFEQRGLKFNALPDWINQQGTVDQRGKFTPSQEQIDLGSGAKIDPKKAEDYARKWQELYGRDISPADLRVLMQQGIAPDAIKRVSIADLGKDPSNTQLMLAGVLPYIDEFTAKYVNWKDVAAAKDPLAAIQSVNRQYGNSFPVNNKNVKYLGNVGGLNVLNHTAPGGYGLLIGGTPIGDAEGMYKAALKYGLSSDEINKVADLMEKSGVKYKPGEVYSGVDVGYDPREVAAGSYGTKGFEYLSNRPSTTMQNSEAAWAASQLGLAYNRNMMPKIGQPLFTAETLRPSTDSSGRPLPYGVIGQGGYAASFFADPADAAVRAPQQGIYGPVIDLRGRDPFAKYAAPAARPGDVLARPTGGFGTAYDYLKTQPTTPPPGGAAGGVVKMANGGPTAEQLQAQQSIVADPQAAALAAARSGIAAGLTNQQIADQVNQQYGKNFTAQNVADFMASNNLTRPNAFATGANVLPAYLGVNAVAAGNAPSSVISTTAGPGYDYSAAALTDPTETAINDIYNRVLGRQAEQEGLNYWANAVRNKTLSLADVEGRIKQIGQDIGVSVDPTQLAAPTAAQKAAQMSVLKDPQAAALAAARSGIAAGMTDQQIADMVNMQYGKNFSAQNVADFMAANDITRPAPVGPVVPDRDTTSGGTDTLDRVTLAPLGTPGQVTQANLTTNQVRDIYEQGGGSTKMPVITDIKPTDRTYTQNQAFALLQGYLKSNPNALYGDVVAFARGKGIPEMQARAAYNEYRFSDLKGGSSQAYDYLMGRGAYPVKPFTPTGELMRPYAEAVLGAPENIKAKRYLYDAATQKYVLNPAFVPRTPSTANAPIRDQTGSPVGGNTESYFKANPDVYQRWLQGDTGMTADAYARYHWETFGQKEGRKGWSATTTTGGGKTGDTDTGTSGGKAGGLMARGGLADVAAAGAAGGGQFNLGGYSDGGRLLRGPGDGVSDSIPATIGDRQPARLADGEFVVPARIVSEIGNGSTEAGARKLYAMMDRVQRARAKTTGKGKVAKNTRAEKYLPA